MSFIAFLGCDGCGKSSVLDGVSRELKLRNIPVVRGHWRPRPLAAGDSGTPASDPHGLPPRGWIGSTAKLGWLWLNWWLSWITELHRASRKGVVLFDRYHADLLIDPRRYRYGGSKALAKLAQRLMPQPDRVIFLDAPPEVIFARKQEVDEDSLARYRAAYLDWCSRNSQAVVVDATKPLSEVVEAVTALIVPHR